MTTRFTHPNQIMRPGLIINNNNNNNMSAGSSISDLGSINLNNEEGRSSTPIIPPPFVGRLDETVTYERSASLYFNRRDHFRKQFLDYKHKFKLQINNFKIESSTFTNLESIVTAYKDTYTSQAVASYIVNKIFKSMNMKDYWSMIDKSKMKNADSLRLDGLYALL